MRKVVAGAAALAAAAVAGFGLSQVGDGSPDSATAASSIAPGAKVSYLVSGSRHTGKVVVYVDDTLVLVTDDVSKTTQRHLARAELTDLTPPAQTTTATTAPTTTTAPPPPPDTQPPSVPQGQAFGAVTQTTVRLDWNASTDNVAVVGYHVFQDDVPVTNVPSPGYTYQGLTCGTSHTFAVEAYDAAGNVSDRAAATGTTSTSACDPPPPPPTETVGTTEPPPPPPTGALANVWADLDGGTCLRKATPTAYVDAESCGPIWQLGWAKMSSGDSMIVKNDGGPYPQQVLTGNKTAPTFIVGEDGVVVSAGVEPYAIPTAPDPVVCGYQDGLVCANANYLNLRNVVVDALSQHGQSIGAEVNGANVTFDHVSFHGSYVSIYPRGAAFSWNVGSLGKDGVNGLPRKGCGVDGEPVWIESSATGATFDSIRFNSMSADGTACSGSVDGFHLEIVRVQGTQNVTIRNSVFVPDAGTGNGAGSGKIFVTNTAASDTAANGLHLIGNTFGSVKGSFSMQTHANVRKATGWQIKSNAFAQDAQTPTLAAGAACGNTGPVSASWRGACP